MPGGLVPCVQDEGIPAALGSNPPKSLRPSPSLFQGHAQNMHKVSNYKKFKLNNIVISDKKVPSVVLYIYMCIYAKAFT